MKKYIIIVGAFCAVAIWPAHGAGASSAAEPTPPDPSIATYGEQTLDLSESWGSATACLSTDTETTCFASERELDKYVAGKGLLTTAGKASGLSALSLQCASSVKLYSSASYTGQLFEVIDRQTVIDLGAYGFSNVTSSYRIGACAAYFWDGVGGGSVYPGNTNVGVWSASMVAGWDNRISSLVLG